MSLWPEIARILARESAYRSIRQGETLRTPSFWRGSGSIIEVNFIPAIIFTGMLLLFGFLMLYIQSASFFVMLGAIQLLTAFLFIALIETNETIAIIESILSAALLLSNIAIALIVLFRRP